jgi:hypothetical protein
MDGNEALNLEQEMIKQEQLNQTPPEEVAAAMFNLYLPRFQAIVSKLSNKSLRRVLKALIEYPLVEEDFKFSGELEKEAFLVAENLILAKVMMINHTLLQHEQDLHTQETSDTVESEALINQEEIVNG